MTETCQIPQAPNTNKEKLGVLYVHGIGEQKKGETILSFGDPLIVWLKRWLLRDGRKLIVERVETDDDTPSDVVISTSGSADKVIFKECWWANKFKPPSVFELGWWMLLVGTCATFLHASKQFRQNKWWSGNFINAIFRSVFFFIPVALTFQIIVCTLTLLGSVPFTPWRNFCASLLLKFSKTLGDSFVFISSPIQRRMAFDTVLGDLDEMLSKCDQVIVIAHSQGAAITYKALLPENLFSTECKSRVTLVSVGSGLEKLDELERLNAVLEFQPEPSSTKQHKHILYFSPLLFLACWISVLAIAFNGWSLGTGLFAGTSIGITIIALTRLLSLKRERYEHRMKRWYDIHATSDPVSNGRMDGPNDDIEITNEKSLLRDHSTYFSNRIDFIPRVLNIMHECSAIEWLANIELSSKLKQDHIEPRSEELAIAQTKSRSTLHSKTQSRSTRKTLLVIGKWFTGLGFIAYIRSANHSLSEQLRDSVDVLFSLADWFTNPSIFARMTSDSFHLISGLLAAGCLYFFLITCDQTAERSDANLLFADDAVLRAVVATLTVAPVIVPLVAWAMLIF